MLVDKIVARFGGDLPGERFALWGLAFKPNTDDMREAPSRARDRRRCSRRGARVVAYDPVAMDEARRVFGDAAARRVRDLAAGRARRAPTRWSIVTEWKEFRSPDFDAMRAALKRAADLRRPQPVRPGARARPRASSISRIGRR